MFTRPHFESSDQTPLTFAYSATLSTEVNLALYSDLILMTNGMKVHVWNTDVSARPATAELTVSRAKMANSAVIRMAKSATKSIQNWNHRADMR